MTFDLTLINHHHHHHNHSTALFRDHPGELVPEGNFWTLWCKGRLTEADTYDTVRYHIIRYKIFAYAQQLTDC